MLNEAIKVGTCHGCYNGGKGVLLRNPFDDYEGDAGKDFKVVPATFMSNDIITPSGIFPSGTGFYDGNGNPDCPNSGTNGYYTMKQCPTDPKTGDSGPWNYAATAYVIASSLDKVFKDFDNIQKMDWGWGVFYPTDSNSVDGRCEWLEDENGYDCPGGFIPWGKDFQKDPTRKGAGAYPQGNPFAVNGGGGAGCHAGLGGTNIDQAFIPDGANVSGLVKDKHCQCNYKFNQNWGEWVEAWIQHGENPHTVDGWFGQGKAPFHALDQTSCWMNNPRDMINLQNHIYFERYKWSNQLAPQSKWANDDPSSLRTYWGWNEVPISRETAQKMQLRDAVVVKLPAATCGGNGGDDSIGCLENGYQEQLEADLGVWVKYGMMKVGLDEFSNRPGSSIVILREWMHNITGWTAKDNWSRWFFCENWQSPNKKYKIVFMKPSQTHKSGACYLDSGDNLRSQDNQMTTVFV